MEMHAVVHVNYPILTKNWVSNDMIVKSINIKNLFSHCQVLTNRQTEKHGVATNKFANFHRKMSQKMQKNST